MSSGEIVGFMLTTVLLGVLVGLVLGARVMTRRERELELLVQRRDAYARWLAAWNSLARESSSFVAAFRALGAEEQDSDYFSLRCEEAQRARAAWCAAMRELECAEARLLVWSDQPALREELKTFERTSPDRLRAAIEGRQQDVHEFVGRVQDTAERASRYACASTQGDHSRQLQPVPSDFRLAILDALRHVLRLRGPDDERMG